MKHLYLTFILVILAVSAAGFVYWRYFFLATVAIDPLPGEATISVNGKPSVDRTLKLPRGSYEISVDAPGYRSHRFNVNVSYGSTVNKRVVLEALPRPSQVISGPISSLQPSTDKKEVFFEQGGAMYRFPISADLPPVAIPITPSIAEITAIDWSPDFTLALIRKENGETGLYDFNRYDLLHQEYRPLGKTIGDTAWKQDGSGFFYENIGDNRALVLANKAGANSNIIASLIGFPMDSLKLQLAQNNMLVVSGSANDSGKPTDIVIVDTYQKTINAITESGRALYPILSPSKDMIAYLDSGELVTGESTGKNKRNHALRPRPGSYAFIDEINLAVFTPNLVTVINTTNGEVESYDIYAPSDEINDLFADPSGKILFYTHKGSLYQINYRP